MHVIILKWWTTKPLKTISLCTISLEINHWNQSLKDCLSHKTCIWWGCACSFLVFVGEFTALFSHIIYGCFIGTRASKLILKCMAKSTNSKPHNKTQQSHDDVIKWKHFPRYWPFVRGIHRSPVNSPHKGQWRGALMFSLICTRINGWVNNGEAGDLRRHRAHYDVTVMVQAVYICKPCTYMSSDVPYVSDW